MIHESKTKDIIAFQEQADEDVFVSRRFSAAFCVFQSNFILFWSPAPSRYRPSIASGNGLRKL